MNDLLIRYNDIAWLLLKASGITFGLAVVLGFIINVLLDTVKDINTYRRQLKANKQETE